MRGYQRGPDEIDLWCMAWARTRRVALGIVEGKMIEPKERIGQLRCTLGKVRSDREGASYTQGQQIFPEVYTGITLDVHRGIMRMPGRERLATHLHYVWREIPVSTKRLEIPVSNAAYWTIISTAKSFLNGYINSLSMRETA